jgi:hypothetical protein
MRCVVQNGGGGGPGGRTGGPLADPVPGAEATPGTLFTFSIVMLLLIGHPESPSTTAQPRSPGTDAARAWSPSGSLRMLRSNIRQTLSRALDPCRARGRGALADRKRLIFHARLGGRADGIVE